MNYQIREGCFIEEGEVPNGYALRRGLLGGLGGIHRKGECWSFMSRAEITRSVDRRETEIKVGFIAWFVSMLKSIIP